MIAKSQFADELMRFCEVAWFDLPLAAAGRITGRVDDKSLNEAGWKTYEAWVSLANEAANRLYANPAFGEATGRAFETALRLQRVGDALASAFFGNLWPALGLPTRSQIDALRGEVIALREQVANAPAAPESDHSAETRAEHAPASGAWPRALRNDASHEKTWANGNGKQRVAA